MDLNVLISALVTGPIVALITVWAMRRKNDAEAADKVVNSALRVLDEYQANYLTLKEQHTQLETQYVELTKERDKLRLIVSILKRQISLIGFDPLASMAMSFDDLGHIANGIINAEQTRQNLLSKKAGDQNE